MEYENTCHMHSAVMAQAESASGFDAEARIALIGRPGPSDYQLSFSGSGIKGIGPLRNAYSREKFFRCYLGVDLNFAAPEELEALRQDPRVKAMPRYPYFGYVQKVDGFIVVKLEEDWQAAQRRGRAGSACAKGAEECATECARRLPGAPRIRAGKSPDR